MGCSAAPYGKNILLKILLTGIGLLAFGIIYKAEDMYIMHKKHNIN